MSTQTKTKAPTLIAYQVTGGGENGKAFWSRVGAAWPNKAGGFNLKLEAMPMGGGSLVLLPPRERGNGVAA